MTEEPTRTFDQTVLSAWQDELKATRNPSLKQQLSYREGELLPRFAEHYQQLKALCRRVQRSLQRHGNGFSRCRAAYCKATGWQWRWGCDLRHRRI
jgi:hypothetical protein